jgi:hypothetical protein
MSTSLAELTCERIQVDVQAAISEAMDEIQAFANSREFRQSLNEMFQLPEELRHEFVSLVFLNFTELSRLGIEVPKGIKIQRSEFQDKRPTLFCVSKNLPEGLVWRKVTITFDNTRPATYRPIDHRRIDPSSSV